MTSDNTKSPIPGIALLTVIFVGAFFVLRALPDAQCGFLHYEEVVNADGEIEFCATNHAGFLDLTRLEYPLEIALGTEDGPASNGAIVPGPGVRVTLDLTTRGGMHVAPHKLAVTHTEKMHVMVIDPSLEDYHHVHPRPEGIDGRYTFEFAPERAGPYRVFTEVVPAQTRRQVIATGTIPVDGDASEMKFSRTTASVVDGLRFELKNVPGRLQTGTDYRLSLRVTSADGAPVVLEEIMGARGHMVAFDAARKGFAHMHPVDSIVSARAGLGSSRSTDRELAFLFNVPNPGWYRIFAQVQVEGREVFGRFDLRVE